MKINIDKAGKITISDFSPVQAYKIAVKMERDGIVFYQGLLENVKDQDIRRELDFLIKEEESHLNIFQGLLSREKEESGDAFEEDDVVDYIKSRVFDASLKQAKLSQMEHRHTALEEAMNMERRSIVFYEACMDESKGEKEKSSFLAIMEQEKKHLYKFAELLRIKCINSQNGCIL